MAISDSECRDQFNEVWMQEYIYKIMKTWKISLVKFVSLDDESSILPNLGNDHEFIIKKMLKVDNIIPLWRVLFV